MRANECVACQFIHQSFNGIVSLRNVAFLERQYCGTSIDPSSQRKTAKISYRVFRPILDFNPMGAEWNAVSWKWIVYKKLGKNLVEG